MSHSQSSKECSHCTIYCTCDATRFDMFIPVAASRRPSPTVAARRQDITRPSDSVQLASCRQSRCVTSLGVDEA